MAQHPPAVTLPRWKRVLFGSVLLVLVWASLEGIAVLYLNVARGYDGEHLYEFEFDPYKNIIPARGYVDTRGIRHNSQGFRRSTEVARAKPDGTYRIFLMGGSAAYGTGGMWPHLQRDYAVIPNDSTIDAYLERELGAALPDRRVEVINAAITSTWTHHHLIYLNQTILRYDPDMVLFLDGFNDFYSTSRDHDQFASYVYNTQASSIMGAPTIGSLVRANGWWLYRRSPFVHVTVRALRNLKGAVLAAVSSPEERAPIDVEGAIARLETNFPENALRMHRRSGLILRDEGVIPVFMLQPMLILERGRKPMPPAEQQLFEFNVSSYLPNYEEFSRRAVAFVSAREQAMASEIGAEFIDLTGIYAGVPDQIYTDYVHLTPGGNARLASHVAERILPLIRADVAACDSCDLLAHR